MSYVDSNGVLIHYEIEGSGFPLVLRHGMSDSLMSWQEYGYAARVEPLPDGVP